MDHVSAFFAPLPSKMIFGSGKVSEVGGVTAAFSRRALLVIGGRSLRASGNLTRIEKSLQEASVEYHVVEGVPAEPPVEWVDTGREALRDFRAEVVVAAGGGSVLDVAKGIAALAREKEPCVVYHRGEKVVTERGLPLVALPTTSGTGTEATPNAVLTDRERRVKASLRGGDLEPAVALVDPALTLSCPPEVTAHAGFDAMVQAFEAYVSTGANAFTDPIALRALVHMAPALRPAVADGSDLAAREAMSIGSLLAGVAFASARLGLVHGMAHPIGELHHVPHGLVCGLLLPAVMEFNLPVAGAKYALAARALRVADTHADDEEAAQALIEWFAGLVADLTGGQTLAKLGLTAAEYDFIADYALASGSTKHNPRAVTAHDLREIVGRLAAPS